MALRSPSSVATKGVKRPAKPARIRANPYSELARQRRFRLALLSSKRVSGNEQSPAGHPVPHASVPLTLTPPPLAPEAADVVIIPVKDLCRHCGGQIRFEGDTLVCAEANCLRRSAGLHVAATVFPGNVPRRRCIRHGRVGRGVGALRPANVARFRLS